MTIVREEGLLVEKKPCTLAEFLAFVDKNPKAKAFFTAIGVQVETNPPEQVHGTMNIFLDPSHN